MGVLSPDLPVCLVVQGMGKGVIYIQAWASALLVQRDWAMPEASKCGTGNGKFRAFFVYIAKRFMGWGEPLPEGKGEALPL